MKNFILLSIMTLILMVSTSCKSSTENTLSSPSASPTNNYSKDSKYITDDNSYLSIIEGNDKVLLKANGNLYCTKTSVSKIMESNQEYFRDYQSFLSDDGNIVYYNTNGSSVDGKLCYYDIKNNKYGDLLKEMGIKIQGYVSLISYKSEKIIVLVGDYNTNNSKIDTDTLIEINLKEKKHKIIKIPFIPSGAWVYNGLSYLGDNFCILCSYKTIKDYNQLLVVLDNEGNIVEEIVIPEKDMVCSISASPDGSKFTYQTGTSPVDLHLYDMKDRTNKVIYYPENIDIDYGMCTLSRWGKESGNLYYVINRRESDSQKKFQLNVIKFNQ